jgi:hypothetical protein
MRLDEQSIRSVLFLILGFMMGIIATLYVAVFFLKG